MKAAEIARAAIDLVYPRQCQVCGGVKHCDRFAFLCTPCFEQALWIQPPYCEKCGLPSSGRIDHAFTCPHCHDLSLHFDRASALVRFRGVVRHAIHALKYNHQDFWVKALHGWMAAGLEERGSREEVDLLLPVPLHPVRERERGFNQAFLLARELSRQWKVPVRRRALARTRLTETQTHFDREERMANLRGAFEVRSPDLVRGRRVMLVDDVLTTGSTASECARALRKAGATSILVFTLARG
jgi:ComF family protein